MALQIFRADQDLFEVTTLTVDQVVWFKGREVAALHTPTLHKHFAST